MARGRRRDTSDIARPDQGLLDDMLSVPSFPAVYVAPFDALPPDPLREVEDLREWSPDRAAAVRDYEGRAAQVVLPSVRTSHPVFVDAERVAVCRRREVRREVFFAKKLRRGSGGGKRNQWSDVRC